MRGILGLLQDPARAQEMGRRAQALVLAQLSVIASEVAHGRFERRLTQVAEGTELGHLCWNMNDMLDQLEAWVHPHLQPDLTLLFDVPLEVARQRLDAHRTLDKFEKEKEEFFSATRAVYLQRAAQFPGRIRVIDSTQPIAAVNLQIENLIAEL